jgi:alanyl aminopeptidase
VFTLGTLACAGPASDRAEPPAGKLPEGVRPTRYELSLEIVPGRTHFTGRAAISLELEGSQRLIWLHARGLDIEAVRVETSDGAGPGARWQRSTSPGVGTVRLDEPIGPGRATLELRWRASFGRQLEGLYAVEAAGDAYAFTQFEPISARRAFPCFDEPRFKTPFDVTLSVPADQVAIANTPEISRQRDGENVRIRFAATPPLPTYLLAFAVGPLDRVEGSLPPAGPRDRALPFRGVAARGRGAELRYALEHTPALLEALEAYFGSPYPFAKLDVIAVPDFKAGAMENVGAVTFRESLLLVNPDTAPEWQRRAFANVMAHELAHMWFGNLVTMPWWDDVWLNEAFATWAAAKAVDTVHPEYQPQLSQLRGVHHAMQADSLASARRIRQPIASDHDIANAFDSITYQKGGGVLSMFESWLGPEIFRDGVRAHMERHAFGNATYEDLLHSLGEASGTDLRAPFESFLTQPGVPFLRAARVCDDGESRLEITQERYRPAGARFDAAAQWQIPVCAHYGVGEETREHCDLLSAERAELILDAAACPDWVMPNAGGAGYYRYAAAGDGDLGLAAASGRLSPRERLAAADSLTAAFRAGALPADVVLPALAPLAADPRRVVAEAPMSLLKHVLRRQVDETTRLQAEAFAAELYLPRLRDLGWESGPAEDGESRLLRGSVVRFLALEARHPPTRAAAARRGRAIVSGSSDVDPDATTPETLGTMLVVAVQDSGPEVFDALAARLAETQDAVERSRILYALGASLEPGLAVRARSLALDPEVRVNEMFSPLHAQMAEPARRAETWRWIEANHERLLERAGPSLGGRLPGLAASFCDDDAADRVEAFFAPFIDGLRGGPRNLAGAVESIRLCAALTRAQSEATNAFFGKR